MGDIIILNPLQSLVATCARVPFRKPWDAGNVRRRMSFKGHASVGVMLLAVRNGKCWMRGLDNLAYPKPTWRLD